MAGGRRRVQLQSTSNNEPPTPFPAPLFHGPIRQVLARIRTHQWGSAREHPHIYQMTTVSSNMKDLKVLHTILVDVSISSTSYVDDTHGCRVLLYIWTDVTWAIVIFSGLWKVGACRTPRIDPGSTDPVVDDAVFYSNCLCRIEAQLVVSVRGAFNDGLRLDAKNQRRFDRMQDMLRGAESSGRVSAPDGTRTQIDGVEVIIHELDDTDSDSEILTV